MNIPAMLKRVGMLAATAAAGGTLPGVGGVGSVLMAGMKNSNNQRSSSNAGAMSSKSNADGNISQMYGQEFKKKIDHLLMNPEDRLINKRIRKEEEAASKRLGTSIPTIRLLNSSPGQLISNTTSIVNNTSMLMVQLMQLNTKYVIAISNALGASVDRIFADTGKDGLLSKISKMLDSNPVTGIAKKTVQHAVNIVDLLNPLTMSKKFTNFFQGFGESIQKMVLGEEGFKNLRNPNRTLKRAGLDLADSKKSINLLKVIADVNIKQLDVLHDLRNVFRKVAADSGHNVGYDKLDIAFDEFSGTLMSTTDASRRRMSRERQYKDVYRSGFGGGVGGLIGKAISLPMVMYKNRKSVRDNPNIATQRDRILVEELFINGMLEDIFLGVESANDVRKLLKFKPGHDIDIRAVSDRDIKRILSIVEKAANSPRIQNNNDLKDKYYTMLNFSTQSAGVRAFTESSTAISGKLASLFSQLSGKHINTNTSEATKRYRNFLNTGSDSLYAINSGAANADFINDQQREFIINKLKRGLMPIIGGILEMKEDYQLDKNYEALAPGGQLNGGQLTPKNLSAQTVNVNHLAYKKFAIGSSFESSMERDVYRGTFRAIGELNGKFGKDTPIALGYDQSSTDNRQTASEYANEIDEKTKVKTEEQKNKREEEYQKTVIDSLSGLNKSFDGFKNLSKPVKKKDGGIDWSKIMIAGGIGASILQELNVIGYIKELGSKLIDFIWGFVKEHPQGVAETLGVLAGGYFAKTALFKAVPWVLNGAVKLLRNPATWPVVLGIGGLAWTINNAVENFQEGDVLGGISQLFFSGIIGLPVIKTLTKAAPGIFKFIGGLKGKSIPVMGAGMFGASIIGFLMNDISNSFDENGKFKGFGTLFENLLTGDSYFSAAAKWGLIGLRYGGIYGGIAGLVLGPMIKLLTGEAKANENLTRDELQYIDPMAAGMMNDPDQIKKDVESANNFKKSLPENLSENEKQRIHLLSTKPFYYERAKEAGTLPQYLIDNPPSFAAKNETGSGPDDAFGQGNNRQQYVNFSNMVNTDSLGKFATNIITGALDSSASVIRGIKNLADFGSSSDGRSVDGGLPPGIDVENGEIGSISGYYESGNKSTAVGCDKNGGTSYGKHQFSSKKGSVKEFLEYVKGKSKLGKEFYDAMYSAVNGNWANLHTGSTTGAPVNVWKKYMVSPELQKYEYEFNLQKKYLPAFNKLPPEAKQLVSGSRALQEALFSTVIQHGPGKVGRTGEGAIPIFTKSYRNGMTPEEYLEAIYEERKTRFPNSTSNERASVQRRLEKEKRLLISISDGSYKQKPENSGKIPSFGGTFQGYPNITQENLEAWRTNEQLYWPADSNVITSPFGPRNVSGGSPQHMGIDVRADTGAPIRAIMGGEVEGTSNSYGQIVIKHPGGWKSKYLHLSKFNVKKGDRISPGDVIGGSGGIGKSGEKEFTPHLHLEMSKDGQRVDPEAVFYSMNKTGQVRGNYTPGVYKHDVPESSKLASRIIQQDKSETGDDQMSMLNNKLSELTNERERNKIEDIKRTYRLMSTKQSTPAVVPVPISTEGVTMSSNGGVSVSTGDSELDRVFNRAFNITAAVVNESVIIHTGAVSLST